MSLHVGPVSTIIVPSAVNASVRGTLTVVAGANVTLDAVRAGRTTTLTIAATSGSGGTPAASVVAETSFSGVSPAVGASTDYARADHTHGTPADAPSDGTTYGRKDGGWEPTGGGGLSQAQTLARISMGF